MIIWTGLSLSIGLLLLISQRNLYAAMFIAAVVLGLITLPVGSLLSEVYATFSNPSIIALAAAVAIISLIGGVLEESGGMESLVSNMRIGKRPFLGFAPALLGMLPMPGGALMSAPMVESSGKELQGSTQALINVWFRHILFFIYPLSPALIASAKIANLQVYNVLPYLLPFFLASLILGYVFFLQQATDTMTYEEAFSLRGLMVPLGIILSAPIIDFAIKMLLHPSITELATLAGVTISFIAAVFVANYGINDLLDVTKDMKPWNFALIIFGMFTFLNVFKASGAPETLGKLDMPLAGLLVGISFILGLGTGRLQAPASIVIPIFLARSGADAMPLWAFATTYFSIFIGYVASPVHPCVSISVEFFDSSLKRYFYRLAPPAILSLAMAVIIAFFLL